MRHAPAVQSLSAVGNAIGTGADKADLAKIGIEAIQPTCFTRTFLAKHARVTHSLSPRLVADVLGSAATLADDAPARLQLEDVAPMALLPLSPKAG